MSTARTVIFFGRPGSGKGTQTKLLSDQEGYKTFSTGNAFKALRDDTGPLGDRIRADFDAGKLMPDWFAEYLFADTALKLTPAEGIVCEGFPRSPGQAAYADKLFSWLGREYKVLNLAVTDEEAVRRLLARSLVEDRPDSSDEAKAKARLSVYHEQTDPALAFFKERGVLVEIDGMKTPEEIAADVRSALSL